MTYTCECLTVSLSFVSYESQDKAASEIAEITASEPLGSEANDPLSNRVYVDLLDLDNELLLDCHALYEKIARRDEECCNLRRCSLLFRVEARICGIDASVVDGSGLSASSVAKTAVIASVAHYWPVVSVSEDVPIFVFIQRVDFHIADEAFVGMIARFYIARWI